jgi:hypothetical protein
MADLTFLMNVDPAGSTNQFYALAKQYFVAAGSMVVDAPANGQTLEGVFTELKKRKVEQKTINVVSHAVGFGAIEGPITLASQAAGRTFTIADDLQDALAAKSLAPPGPGVITDKTRVVLYGCDVGRSFNFLKLLSGLFGNPGELLAPRRLSVFKLDGSTAKYRQAHSWSLVRRAPLTPAGVSAPTGGWAAFRTQFVKDASDKFARAAIQAEIDGDTRLNAILTAAASNATKAMASTFFMEETIDIFPTGSQTAKEAAESVKPISNGDPVKAAAQSAAQVDDTTVVTTISGADAYPANAANTKYSITVLLLAQVIDEDVLVAEGPSYTRVTASKGLAPSPGPNPVGGSSGSGSSGGPVTGGISAEFQAVIDQLLAAGVPQTDIDALLAAIPQGDAAEGLATGVPTEDEEWATESPDYLEHGEPV